MSGAVDIRDVFARRPRDPEYVFRLVLEAGWPRCVAARWAANEAGIRLDEGWTPAQIERIAQMREEARP